MRFLITRNAKARGDLAAGTLAELQSQPLKLAARGKRILKHIPANGFPDKCPLPTKKTP